MATEKRGIAKNYEARMAEVVGTGKGRVPAGKTVKVHADLAKRLIGNGKAKKKGAE